MSQQEEGSGGAEGLEEAHSPSPGLCAAVSVTVLDGPSAVAGWEQASNAMGALLLVSLAMSPASSSHPYVDCLST